jgi:hypothetical protein
MKKAWGLEQCWVEGIQRKSSYIEVKIDYDGLKNLVYNVCII